MASSNEENGFISSQPVSAGGAEPAGDGWISHRAGDPIPQGHVRIRHDADDDHWESTSFLPGREWAGWESGAIAAYLPENSAAEKAA